MNKRYHSVIKRVVLWPLVIMLLLSAAVFTVAVLFYNQTKERETDSRIAMMDSGYAQLENIMKSSVNTAWPDIFPLRSIQESCGTCLRRQSQRTIFCRRRRVFNIWKY